MATVPVAELTLPSGAAAVRSADEVAKDDGPFKCLVCAEALTLKRGPVRRAHFCHLPQSACGGTGESITHAFAKRLVAGHFAQWAFRDDRHGALAAFGAHGQGQTAAEEQACHGFRLDVGVTDAQGRVVAAVEICHTHAVEDRKFDELQAQGVEVLEVAAEAVIVAYREGLFTVKYVNRAERRREEAAARAQELEAQEAERLRKQEEQKRAAVKARRPCVTCKRWADKAEMQEQEAPRAAGAREGFRFTYVCRACATKEHEAVRARAAEKQEDLRMLRAAEQYEQQTAAAAAEAAKPKLSAQQRKAAEALAARSAQADEDLRAFDFDPFMGPKYNILRSVRYRCAFNLGIKKVQNHPNVRQHLAEFPEKDILFKL